MGYLGSIAPFYISRYRLKLLADRVNKGGFKLAGNVLIPGIGEIEIDYNRVDSATGAMLEKVVANLDRDDAICDPREGTRRFGWVWINGKIAWVEDKTRGVDHLIAADLCAKIPSNWRCLLVGSRANLTSLVDAELPSLGSSPIAIQAAVDVYNKRIAAISDKFDIVYSNSIVDDSCQRLLYSAEAVSADPSAIKWSMLGLVEIIAHYPREHFIVGSPLFLTYYFSDNP